MNARTPPLDTLPMVPDRALPPKTGIEEYEIERVLAQSSFSIVYRAYDHVLKLHVAIKEYLPDALALRGGETQVVLRNRAHAERFALGAQAFVGEAQTLARCDHPSLLRVLRILQRHGTYYRVMRYAPGPTLLALRRETGAAPDARVLRAWVDGLLGALEALHDEGCVHGAVAPGNVLLLPGDKPVLLDFDAVRSALISDRTQSMMAALEPCFAPPEQHSPDGDAVQGPWTDLYSLAATLHYAVGGELPPPPAGLGPAEPFEGFDALWRRLAAGQRELGEPPGWLGALDACLRDDPAHRPQSVAELRGQLALATVAEGPRRPRAPRAAPRTLSELKLVPAAPVPEPVRPVAVSAEAPRSPLQEAAAEAAAGPAAAPRVGTVAPPGAGVERAAAATAAAPPSVSEMPEAPAAPAAPLAQPAGPGEAAPPLRSAMSTPQSRMIADLDETFAFIARQASEEAAAPKPPAPAAPAAALEPPLPAVDAAPRAFADSLLFSLLGTRHGRWVLGGFLVLLLVVAIVAGVWMVRDTQGGLPGAAIVGEAAPTLSKPAAAALAAPPPLALPQAPTAAGPPPAVNDALPPDPPAKPAAAPPSPRQQCGRRSGYALFECMKEQCAKRANRQHEQCVRLRKEQRLSWQAPAASRLAGRMPQRATEATLSAPPSRRVPSPPSAAAG